jgi:mono/diheme cytochrome c family protein
MARIHARRVTLAVLAAGTIGCSQGYVPGLGEFMSLNQMRHAKLWYAGQAHNWALAKYELDELQEGFDEIVRRYPTYQDSPAPLATLMPQIMTTPMADLRAAVNADDPVAFTKGFDAFTAACNACHQAANHGFNVIKRPEGPGWYSNQEFSLP